MFDSHRPADIRAGLNLERQLVVLVERDLVLGPSHGIKRARHGQLTDRLIVEGEISSSAVDGDPQGAGLGGDYSRRSSAGGGRNRDEGCEVPLGGGRGTSEAGDSVGTGTEALVRGFSASPSGPLLQEAVTRHPGKVTATPMVWRSVTDRAS